MNDLKVLIRQSYDVRPATETLSWSSINSRRVNRRKGWRLSFALLAVLIAGSVAVTTAGTDPNRLPPTDFDVALAPNWDAQGAVINGYYGLDGRLVPGPARANGGLLCNEAPGSRSTFMVDYGTIGDFRALTEADLIAACQKVYDIDWYRREILAKTSPTAGELRGGSPGSVVLPDEFVLCYTEVDPGFITLIPGFKGITDLSNACQELAMHPLDFGGEKREHFYIADFHEYQAWLERARAGHLEYQGFRTLD